MKKKYTIEIGMAWRMEESMVSGHPFKFRWIILKHTSLYAYVRTHIHRMHGIAFKFTFTTYGVKWSFRDDVRI